jgi:hypothetical protein
MREILLSTLDAGFGVPVISEADVDVVDWTHHVMQVLVAYGGPILLLQVRVIAWLVASQVVWVPETPRTYATCWYS